ncbi:MAG: methionyl-tRNA formyltransferase [Chloroflexi bacterium]|nr:methionyl-tRNA formyltransferase [Chloroflexota bacterium]
MGSPEFAVPSLNALLDAGYNVVSAVSQPDRPAGRGGATKPPAVKVAALARGLAVFQPESFRDEGVRQHLAALRPDLFVVAAYGKILPGAVLALPSRGCVNVHASLLPRWRGPSPINAAILAGDAGTGVTIMEMSAKMDAGPTIARTPYPLRADVTAGEAERDLAALGARTLVETLPRWYDGDLKAEPQDETLVTYCPLLAKSDGHLRASMTAAEAERAVRAYNPWPGASVEYRGGRLAIWRARVVPSASPHDPGALVLSGREPAVAFKDALLVLEEVQRGGSKRMPGAAFVNGERGNLPAAVGLA